MTHDHLEPELLNSAYDELRKIAAVRLSMEHPGQTLTPTALVHEAWLRLSGASNGWNDRSHFLRAASIAMRRILVDRARAKLTDKRGGQRSRVEMTEVAEPEMDSQILAVDAALSKLAGVKPDHARLVELRFFSGLSGDEAATVLEVSPANADRMWRYARAWLQVQMENEQ